MVTLHLQLVSHKPDSNLEQASFTTSFLPYAIVLPSTGSLCLSSHGTISRLALRLRNDRFMHLFHACSLAMTTSIHASFLSLQVNPISLHRFRVCLKALRQYRFTPSSKASGYETPPVHVSLADLQGSLA